MKRSIMLIGIAAIAISLGGCHKKKDAVATPAAEASSASLRCGSKA